ADTLVSGDTNGDVDIFVRDRETGETRRVSVGNNGAELFSSSYDPVVSSDGRSAAFFTPEPVPGTGDANIFTDMFVTDLTNHVTTLASLSSSGASSNPEVLRPSRFSQNGDGRSLSADGRFAAFAASSNNLVPNDTNGVSDIFVRDRATNTTTRVSVSSAGAQANNGSLQPALSADGRFVAFQSSASNLVPGDTNGRSDIFVHDRVTGVTTRVSVADEGVQADGDSSQPTLSADGRFVAFSSSATNLVTGDTNGVMDVFVHDRLTGQTRR